MLKSLINNRPARYLAVGAICAVMNNIILIAGDAAGLHYWSAVLLTFVLVVPPSYVAHASWVFGVRASWHAFGRYVAGTLSSLVVAALAVGLLRGALLLPMVVAAPIATLAMVLYNYLMTRWAVYRGHGRAAPSFADPTA
jgi:putative flippase GtrA